MPDINTVVVTPTVSVVQVNSSVPGSYADVGEYLGGQWRVLHPEDYGAVGDGTTDDTAAFTAMQAALTAGGSVELAAGRTYYLASTFTITEALTFFCRSRYATLKLRSAGGLKAGSNAVRFLNVSFVGDGGASTDSLFGTISSGAYTGWRFEGCLFTGMTVRLSAVGWVDTDGTVSPTGTGHASDWQLVDCEVTGYLGSWALQVLGCQRFLIDRCLVHDNGVDENEGEGIKIQAGATDGKVVSTWSYNNTRDGIDVYDSYGILVEGCVFHDNGVLGMEAKWNSADTSGTPRQRHVVRGNRFHGNAAGGAAFTCDHGILEGNYFKGNGTSASDYQIRLGGSSNGDGTDSVGSRCVGNVCDGSGGAGNGIAVVEQTGADISHNMVLNCGIGISLAATCTDCVVVGNYVSGNSTRGIDVRGVGCRVAANRGQDSGDYYTVSFGTFTTLEGWGQEAAGAGSLPTLANWPKGALVEQTDSGKYYRRGLTDWVRVPSMPRVSADNGDTDQTLSVRSDDPIQLWATTLTQNRTVTLSTSESPAEGDWFRIVRTGLGAFTLNVGGLKTIPSATAAFVEVTFDGSAWILTGYGVL